jgi:hypothetical protein
MPALSLCLRVGPLRQRRGASAETGNIDFSVNNVLKYVLQ